MSEEKTESHLVPCSEIDTCKMCERFCNNILEKVDQKSEVPSFKIGDRVSFKYRDGHNLIHGTIKDLPVRNIAWVHWDGEDKAYEHGYKLTQLELYVEQKQPDKNLGINPKDILGIKKVQLDLVPMTSIIYQAYAMEDGAIKYGPYNWRNTKVQASIYIAAAKRHLDLWLNGEEYTDDTGVPNLGAALACIGIIIDAKIAGTLADNRPKALDPVVLNALLKRSEVKKP